jgi:hypothetical protein
MRRRVEAGIGLAAPFLNLVLYSGEQLSRVAGRNEERPEPPRLGRRSGRTPIGGGAP